MKLKRFNEENEEVKNINSKQRELLIDYTKWLSKQKFERYSSNLVDAFLNNINLDR